MTDRELLELAAFAAGHRIVEWAQDGNGVDVAIIIRGDGDGFSKRPWQPLLENQMTDAEGDALRLAVRVGLDINIDAPRESEPYTDVVGFMCDDSIQLTEVNEPHDDDPYAATRRAIVRAAAEIGRAMK